MLIWKSLLWFVKVYGTDASASVSTAIATGMYEEVLSLPKKLALSFPASLTCHLPWWLQRSVPLSCCCLDITALLWPFASLPVYGGLGTCLQTSFVDRVYYYGVALAHLGGKGGHLTPYHILYGTCQGTVEAKSFQQYHRTGSGSCNSPGLLYKGQALHASKASGAS